MAGANQKGIVNIDTIDGHQKEGLPKELRDELDKLEKQFTVTTEKLKEITKRFQEELEEGLKENGKNIAMFVTWVLGFPTGEEKGSFLTVDLGGTNLRVCWITLNGKTKDKEHDIVVKQDSYTMPGELKTGNASDLWSFIAQSLQKFIEKENLTATPNEPLPLGFTFSYPAIQDYIDQGVLQTWTKGFDIENVEGNDVASQLRSAISDLNLSIEIVAVINDTTGAMIASAYNDPDTIVGAIFGTGCNAAYMDKISNIPKLKGKEQIQNLSPDTPMAINCEYGAFDNARKVLPITRYDENIDADSPRPGEQAFEKLSAGLYLGEIFRLIILDMHDRNLFLKDQDITKLKEPYSIDTAFLSSLEDDSTDSLTQSSETFKSDFNLTFTEPELNFSRLLAHLIAIRGARLCACGVAAISRMTKTTTGHVAADGSVANKHPRFKKRWGQALGEILDWSGEDINKAVDETGAPIVITSAEDGSGVGAAVIAAMTLERWRKGHDAGIKGDGFEKVSGR
ncbi:hypothetical protein LTS08_001349 [Lithohypha guttulata]|uniref:uncharacterized protein n=1 Tax=Lithohypha guttulata TaxID=1690604 RepID=UPI002DE1974A|nr:hypothetical protein LTR51_003985 [Lithohypha guttulata]KAK5105075.1 hypothetical protein LTS08_001349 [Lithohypha guttulata]